MHRPNLSPEAAATLRHERQLRLRDIDADVGHLSISRKSGESVIIDDKITITVLRKRGSQSWLRIEAPRSITIRRAELPPSLTNEMAAAKA